ncbi:hypothetical protein FIU82_07535 [Pseudoalteromonas sp. THAF3]|uniref:hypothetical protein n=1 Tax=Pseudoalteromonas sp. THAF3 TaxID=2587843 RepID=UPI0012690006|nr:hypothetical protein [Pseudoalteromonas sp. THAF3]QFU04864.1 hypothetical protein FIU82_07535 [Pseudoalteromonas sp. THAF3]
MKISNSIELLDWFKESVDIDSDYSLAKLLGFSRQYISKVRNGRAVFSDFKALELAILGKHPEPLKVVAAIEAEREERAGNHEKAKIWREQAA